jgi:hypothetical protein
MRKDFLIYFMITIMKGLRAKMVGHLKDGEVS